MSDYNFDLLPDRISSECVKWHYFDEDVLPMWVADMDFTAPPEVIDALQSRVAHGVFGYAEKVDGLEEAVTDWLETRYQWRVSAEDLVFLPGVVVGLNLAAQTLARDGKGLLIQPPVYPPFFNVSSNAGIPRLEAPLLRTESGSYEIDWEDFDRKLDQNCCQFLFCNPHNPVGRVYEKNELEKIADTCLRKGVAICSDEIHADLIFQGHQHIPIASLDREVAAKTITLLAPSKTFNIPGLDCSFAVIPNPELRRSFKQTRRGLVRGINILGFIAMKAAYLEGIPWLDALMTYLEENRNLVYQFVQEKLPGVKMVLPQGTYLAWLDCSRAGLGMDPCQFFIDHARVGLNDGRIFGTGGENHVRLNFGCPRSLLLEGLTRMAAALEKFQR